MPQPVLIGLGEHQDEIRWRAHERSLTEANKPIDVIGMKGEMGFHLYTGLPIRRVVGRGDGGYDFELKGLKIAVHATTHADAEWFCWWPSRDRTVMYPNPIVYALAGFRLQNPDLIEFTGWITRSRVMREHFMREHKPGKGEMASIRNQWLMPPETMMPTLLMAAANPGWLEERDDDFRCVKIQPGPRPDALVY